MKSHYYCFNKIQYFSLFSLLLVLLLSENIVKAAEREYVVPMKDSEWVSSGKKNYECTLSQTIPFYGEGKFIRKSGHKVRFQLFSDDPVMDDTRLVIQSEPPSWRYDDTVFEIGRFDIRRGHNPVDVKSPYAGRMFQQVENGMSPVIIYRDLDDGRDIIAVMLSPINFRKALKEYRECEQTLLDFDLEEIKHQHIYFATDKSTLTKKAKWKLGNINRYLKMDSDIKQIRVDAFTDSRGRRRYNDNLADDRGDSVVKQLIASGIKPEMIYSVSYGERKSTYSNKTAQGRAKNRRVDVILSTEPPPTPEEREAMKKAREQERRKKLLDRSLFKDLDKRRAEQKMKKMEAQQQTGNETEQETGQETGQEAEQNKEESVNVVVEKPESKEDSYYNEEPPVPNFINFDHLVDKNNQKVPAK
jgi:outer membrane protein OmpA-like peptidoglycan-associated protein